MSFVSFPELIAAACSGEAVISFPTDTVPAVACRPDCSELIFQLKQRDRSKSLILMGANAEDLWPYVQGAEAARQEWQQLAERYWPGQLTLILPASDRVPAAVNAQTPGTVGLRVPDQPIARYLLSFTGPLATTSANLSGQPPLTTAAAIDQQFPNVQQLTAEDLDRIKPEALAQLPPTATLSDLESPQSGQPSTVAQWTATGWQVVRQGAVQLKTKPSGRF
ncbi:MAG: L-threonylcarbamoyladenylate synthase [Leptolyngbya sp. SIO4C1]|nr:L-threonylcarbamoyladenylate synthase [Leptolyngbya sp. SIO4C1]